MLRSLKTRQFRNLAPLEWQPGPGRHLLLGPNGAGKTSVLEAVYILATTKSLRTHRLGECVRHGAEGFFLEAEVETDRRTRLALSWAPGAGMERSVNGGAASLAAHLGVLPVAAWTSAETEVLVGAPALRRRFLDRGVLGLRPAALTPLSRYRQALRQKRDLLLRRGGRKALEPWNGVLAAAAVEILEARHAYIEKLGAALESALEVSGLPCPGVSLLYRPSPRRGLEGREAVEAAFARAAERELVLGSPLVGPHRDDLEVRWGERPVRAVASAGELKALSLLMVAAQGAILEGAGRRPVFLLDDADAELGAESLGRVWKAFGGAGQLFASSNRPEVWGTLGMNRQWRLESGRVAVG